MRASSTALENWETIASWSSLESSVAAIGPALSSDAAKTDPRSNHPRLTVTSFQSAGGPGSVRNRPRRAT